MYALRRCPSILYITLSHKWQVPVVLGDAKVEFASTVEVPATTVFLHPTHNFAVVQYDPQLLTGDSVASAALSDTPIEVGARSARRA